VSTVLKTEQKKQFYCS